MDETRVATEQDLTGVLNAYPQIEEMMQGVVEASADEGAQPRARLLCCASHSSCSRRSAHQLAERLEAMKSLVREALEGAML